MRHDPTDIWGYSALAFIGEDFGLARLGADSARRGLALLEARRDPEHVRGQITEQLQLLKSGSAADREAEMDLVALSNLRAALTSKFVPGPGQPWSEPARLLVPEIAGAQVKRPAGPPELPGPGAAQSGRRKVGRNDPCWWGNGKKYKYCRLQADRAGGR